MMLDQEARHVAQRLGLDRIVEIIAEALPGFRAEVLGAGLRGTENSELHRASLPKNRAGRVREYARRHAGYDNKSGNSMAAVGVRYQFQP